MKRPAFLTLPLLLAAAFVTAAEPARTTVSIVDGRWHINGRITHPGSPAEGRLMNVRMVNATFEDTQKPRFDPDANTNRFIARIPEYAASGVDAFTLCLQGGMPGYEGAVNSAFNADGSLRDSYLQRVGRVLRACDQQGVAVILGLYYQRQSGILKDEEALRTGVVNATRWVSGLGLKNVMIEIANEYPHPGFDHKLIRDPKGQASLIHLAKTTAPQLLVTASGYGKGKIDPEVAQACDFLTPHWNGTRVQDIPERCEALKQYGKPIVCNEDHKDGRNAVEAMEASLKSGASYGLMLQNHNQHLPFHFDGTADDPRFYAALKKLTSPGG